LCVLGSVCCRDNWYNHTWWQCNYSISCSRMDIFKREDGQRGSRWINRYHIFLSWGM